MAFYGLNEQYSLLAPMLFDKTLIKEYTKDSKYGFEVIRQTLFSKCVVDIVNIVKSTKGGVSIEQIAEIFEQQNILRILSNEISNHESIKGCQRLEELQKEAFEKDVYEVKKAIQKLLTSNRYKSFETIRNKRIAHIDLKQQKDSNEYHLYDIAILELKWEDLKKIIDDIGFIVSKLNTILIGIDINIANRQLFYQKISNAFWNIKHNSKDSKDNII